MFAPSLNKRPLIYGILCLYQYLKEETNCHLAWISPDYFESFLLPRIKNDSKQSDEIKANCRRKCFFFCQTNFDFTGNEFVSMGWWNLRLTVNILAFYGQQLLFRPVMLTDTWTKSDGFKILKLGSIFVEKPFLRTVV